jgi:hypothetical protein
MTAYSQYFTQIDELVGQYERSITTFYHKNIQVPLGTAAAKGFGSGFLVEHPKGVVLVTAGHVAREAMKERIVYLRMGNEFLSLEKQPFLIDQSVDLALSLFTFEQLAQEDVAVVSPIKADTAATSSVPSGTYAVIGCPSSRNKIDQRFPRKNTYVNSMTLEAAKIGRFSGTEIQEPLLLHYEPSEMVLGLNMPPDGRPFDLHGMSGGPIFMIRGEVKGTYERESDVTLSFSLAGVAAEWHPEQKLVVGTRLEFVQYLMGYL